MKSNKKNIKYFNSFVSETYSNENTRETDEFEREVFIYLNDLRESGVVNMFGTVPYIMDEFEIDKKEASELLRLWMDNFNEDGDYDIISIK